MFSSFKLLVDCLSCYSCGQKPSFLSLSKIHLEIDNLTLINWMCWTKVSLFLSTFGFLSACLHEGGGPQVGEVTCGRLPDLTCKRGHIKMRDHMDRRATSPKRVISPIWGTPPPCKQALRVKVTMEFHIVHLHLVWSHCFTKCYADWARLKAA